MIIIKETIVGEVLVNVSQYLFIANRLFITLNQFLSLSKHEISSCSSEENTGSQLIIRESRLIHFTLLVVGMCSSEEVLDSLHSSKRFFIEFEVFLRIIET